MYRYPTLVHISCLALSVFATASSLHAEHNVFYLTTGSTITTYNVDATTGIPTQAGTPVTIAGAQFISNVIPTPNDHVIYVFWSNTSNSYSLWVYDTNGSGVPASTPVQKLSAQGWSMIIHPNGKFAYVMKTTSGSQGYSETLYLYDINQQTGALSNGTVQAKYGPDYYYEESLVSFNKSGTRLYDLWGVSFDHENNYYYSYHPVNTSTGQLSADVGTYFAASNYDGLDEQYLTPSYILNLHGDGGYATTELNVFQNIMNPQKPLFTCTQSMLDACAYSYRYWTSADQQYVFLPDSNTNETVIGKIEGSSKKIVETGFITGLPFLYVAPQNQLIYGVNSSGNSVQVYLFDASSGTATSGGSVTFSSSNGYGLFPAHHS